MTEHKQLDEKSWGDFGKSLLLKKGAKPEQQEGFLRSCRLGKGDFLSYIDDRPLSSKDSIVGRKHTRLKHRFTESEFLCPPKDTQKIIWDTFKGMPDEIMCSCGFWGYTVINLIKDDCIKAEYLASDSNGISNTGSSAIDKALQSGNEKTVDKCVRRILRSMCNPGPRGKRVVFNDFPLGKAYWRWRWAQKMSQHADLDLAFEQVLAILDANYYAELSAKMHTGKSYIGLPNILGGLLLYLKQARENGEKITKLKIIIDKIAYLSAWKAIEAQDPHENQIEIQKISKSL